MVKRQFEQKRGFGLTFVSLLLALLLVLSTCVVAITTSMFTASALSEWKIVGNFNNWDYGKGAYISSSGGSVTVDLTGYRGHTIKFKAVAMEPGNSFADDSGRVWCTSVSGGSLSANNNYELSWGSGNNGNYTYNMEYLVRNESVTFTISSSNFKNYIKVTETSLPSGEGGEYNSGRTNKYTNVPVNTQYNGSNAIPEGGIFWAKATYFDYLSDEELYTSKWLKPLEAGTGFDGSNDEWYPFYNFNREVVKNRSTTWNTPLYFGNFCNTGGAYDTSSHHMFLADNLSGYNDATGSSNVRSFNYHANNSNGLHYLYTESDGTEKYQFNESYQNLMGEHLVNNNLVSSDGVTVPYFNENLLGKYAKVIESSFPFTCTEKEVDGKKYSFYEFNSNNAKDNVYFTWATNGNETYPTGVNYGGGTTYGVKDGLKKFMGAKEPNAGYGIFPFNNASDRNKGTKTKANEKLNYGFGIRIDMNFRVPNNGGTDGNPVTFTFSGDDDLWVYITNNSTKESQLILDMGGSHKKSEGTINFKTRKATVKNVYENRTNVNKPSSGQFAFDYDQTYTMSVFYMERGLIESNCHMTFTMAPAGNQVKVNKVVNTQGLNTEKLQNAVKTNDTFGFTAYENGTAKANTKYIYNNGGEVSTNSNGRFTLNNGENAAFLSKFTNGKSVKVSEDLSGAKLSYSTTWSVADPLDSGRNTNGTGLNATPNGLELKNPSGYSYDYAELDYTFTNTPDKGAVEIEKVISGASSDTKGFDATVSVSIDGGYSYDYYPLEYTASDKGSQKFYLSSRGKLDSSALLKQGRKLRFANLPSNAIVKVIENLDSDTAANYEFVSASGSGVTTVRPGGNDGGGTITVPNSNATGAITITNRPISPDSISVPIKAFKFLSSDNGIKLPSNGGSNTDFEFILSLDENGSEVLEQTSYTTIVGNNKAEVDFTPITFNNADSKVYYISEKSGADSDVIYSTDVFKAEISVVKTSDNILVPTTTYYKKSASGGWTKTASNGMTIPSFTNTLMKGSVTINKTNQHYHIDSTTGKKVYDEELGNITFSLYKVDMRGDDPVAANLVDEQTTNSNGVAVFSDLPIYKDNSVYNSDEDEKYNQWYCLVETSNDGNHNPSAEKTYFYLPQYGDDEEPHYDITFSFQNGHIVSPQSGFFGSGLFKTLGLAFIIIALLTGAGFCYTRLRSKSYARGKRYSRK